jgi:ABC-type multidrug transport system fused ATPase/permease subunit
VLRGIGGEKVFRDRYRDVSQQTRTAGFAVAHAEAALVAAKLLLPGAFLVVVTWLGARLALDGAITPGELVAFYAAAAFLVDPMSSVADFVSTRAETRVAADNLANALDVTSPERSGTTPPPDGELADPDTGLIASPNEFTAVVADDAAGQAARLAGLVAAPVTLGGVPLDQLDRAQLRRAITLHEADPAIFSGTVREAVDPWGTAADDAVNEALTIAVARDVVDALPEGLDTVIGEEARTLSGGQRQRVALARAVLGDPRCLVLVEPTSALDTATEIEVAQRVREARAGLATVVFTTSPAFLEIADRVVFLGEDEPVSGDHDTLMATCEPYRRLVERETA